MKEKLNINESDRELEDLLSPKCEFHVSPGFKERVMNEARAIKDIPAGKPSPRKWGWSVVAAASVIAAIMLSALYFTDRVSNDKQILVAKETTSVSDSPAKESETTLLAERTVKKKKQTSQKSTKRKTTKNRKTSKPRRHSLKEGGQSQVPTIIEGEMPMKETESSLEPEEVRERIIERRRNEDIAFIDCMRDEIRRVDDYLARLSGDINIGDGSYQ